MKTSFSKKDIIFYRKSFRIYKKENNYTTSLDIKPESKDEEKILEIEQKIIKELGCRNLRDVYANHNNILNLEYERFVTEFDRKALAWRVSKFILVEMLYYIFHSPSNRNSSAKLKQIILELFQVASSQHEVSAPFFKIS